MSVAGIFTSGALSPLTQSTQTTSTTNKKHPSFAQALQQLGQDTFASSLSGSQATGNSMPLATGSSTASSTSTAADPTYIHVGPSAVVASGSSLSPMQQLSEQLRLSNFGSAQAAYTQMGYNLLG